MSFSNPAPSGRKIPLLYRASGALFPSPKGPRADARGSLLSPLCGSNRNHGNPRLDVAQMSKLQSPRTPNMGCEDKLKPVLSPLGRINRLILNSSSSGDPAGSDQIQTLGHPEAQERN